MKRQGLELLKIRRVQSKLLNEILKREIFPKIFSLFLKHYEVESEALFSDRIIVANKERWLYNTMMFENEEMFGEDYYATIDYIFNYERLIEEYEKYKNKAENWNKEGFMQIGLMYWGDVLLLGMDENKKDEVWRYGNGLINTVLSKLDDNIFDFFSRLKNNIDIETIEELKIEPTQLYRNWGEDFWRVREDEKPA